MQTVAAAIEWIEDNALYGVKAGLENMRRLLARLGDPHKSLACVHVAGTNGKGSVCAMIASGLREAGHRVGLYTSPYLEHFSERMRVNGECISDAALLELAWLVRREVEAMRASGEGSPTFFEICTAIAFCHFARSKVDYAVVEVGVGGRLDSTNVLDQPLLTCITRIGLDHTKALGGTLRAIALEKAGIIKPGVPVVLARSPEAARAALRGRACEAGAPCIDMAEADVRLTQSDLTGQTFDLQFTAPEIGAVTASGVRIRLLGAYQIENASAALAALYGLRARGVPLSEEAIRAGLANAAWAGRLEWFADARTMLDGAHNPMGAHALAEAVQALFSGQPITLVAGCMKDKAYREVAGGLSRFATRAVCTQVDSPRALPAEELCRELSARGVPSVAVSDPFEALAQARAGGDCVVVAGSLYLVGALRGLLTAENAAEGC